MTVHLPVWMQPASGDASLIYTGQELRNFVQAMGAFSEVVAGQQGVESAGDYKVTQRGAGANMTVDVAAGFAFVVGGDVTSQGTYVAWNDGTVNVTGPPFTAPASGTNTYRVVLQIQDKLQNGVWTGYQGVISAALDTGSAPASAITLALVAIPAGSASITNAMITDYRQRVGDVGVFKPADTPLTSSAVIADDPDLQLLNLQASARYLVEGNILYSALNGGGGAAPGDIQFTWSGQSVFKYSVLHLNLAGNLAGATMQQGSDVVTANGQGNATLMNLTILGELLTTAAPARLTFRWAQLVSSATATTIRGHSVLRATRVG